MSGYDNPEPTTEMETLDDEMWLGFGQQLILRAEKIIIPMAAIASVVCAIILYFLINPLFRHASHKAHVHPISGWWILTICLIFTVPIGFGVAWYVRAVSREVEKRWPKYRWQCRVKPVHTNVPQKYIARVAWVLLPEKEKTRETPARPREDRIVRLYRQSRVLIAKTIVLMILVSILILIAMIVEPSYAPWWVIFLAVPILGLMWWVGTFHWRFRMYEVTNLGLRILEVPPVWMPWLGVTNEIFPFTLIKIANAQKALVLGSMLNYGYVVCGTYLDNNEDKLIQKLAFMPEHQEFADDVRDRIVPGPIM